jgi:cell division protein FtsW (lipid II flippase)
MTSARGHERILLFLASVILIIGLVVIDLARTGFLQYKVLGVWACIISLSFVVHLVLWQGRHGGDQLIFPCAMLLAAVGLIMIYRLKPDLFLMQAIWLVIGLIVFLLAAFGSRKIDQLAQYKYLLGIIGIVLLLSAIIFGVDIGGNKNWIIVGPVRFQPSEFAKLFIILFLAAYLNERREVLAFATKQYGPLVLPHPRFIAPLFLVWGLAMLMLVFQRDLGSALLYFATTLIMAYLPSGRFSYLVVGAGLFLLGSVGAYYLYPHVQTRIDIWLNPWSDPNGRSYQVIQSLFALGTGNVLGTGLTYGFPNIIPEVHTDFVFAAIGEELGLVGTVAVLLVYMIIIYRGFRAALTAVTPFRVLVAAGLSIFLALQVILIVGGVTNFLPLTGITLPLISYGGSSMVSNFILLGILLSISEVRRTNAQRP